MDFSHDQPAKQARVACVPAGDRGLNIKTKRAERRFRGLKQVDLAIEEHRPVSVRQIDHLGPTGLDEVGGRDHDLFPPLPGTDAKHGLLHEGRVDERAEALGLPVERGYGPYDVAGRGLDNLGVGQADVAGAQSLLQVA